MKMYEAFDHFLSTDTWYKSHPFDDQRFYQALHSVVRNPEFNADTMGEYMRTKKDIHVDDRESGLAIAISTRVSQAWAVRDYLEANNL